MKALPLLALALLCLLLTACSQGGPAAPIAEPEATPPKAPTAPSPSALLVPTPTPQILSYSIDRAWLVSPSLEEQIFTSKVIVVASLLSATVGTETVPSDPGVASTYQALQVLRFRAHEYLKGTGPKEAVVMVRSRHSYLTEAEARQAADAAVSERNTAWDDRRGGPLLAHPPSAGGAGRSVRRRVGVSRVSVHPIQPSCAIGVGLRRRHPQPGLASGQGSQRGRGSGGGLLQPGVHHRRRPVSAPGRLSGGPARQDSGERRPADSR